jgi:hypothetical protein
MYCKANNPGMHDLTKTFYPLFTSLKAYTDIKRLSVNLKELFKSPLIILICKILRIFPHHGRGGGSN